MDHETEIRLTQWGLGAKSLPSRSIVEHGHRMERTNYSAGKSYQPNKSQIDFQGSTSKSAVKSKSDEDSFQDCKKEAKLEASIGRMRIDLYDQTDIEQDEILGWSRKQTETEWKKYCK